MHIRVHTLLLTWSLPVSTFFSLGVSFLSCGKKQSNMSEVNTKLRRRGEKYDAEENIHCILLCILKRSVRPTVPWLIAVIGDFRLLNVVGIIRVVQTKQNISKKKHRPFVVVRVERGGVLKYFRHRIAFSSYADYHIHDLLFLRYYCVCSMYILFITRLILLYRVNW